MTRKDLILLIIEEYNYPWPAVNNNDRQSDLTYAISIVNNMYDFYLGDNLITLEEVNKYLILQ